MSLCSYTVYVCGIKDYCDGVEVRHVDAKSACEQIAHDLTGIERVKYLGTVKGCSQKDIHVYEDEKSWIYNVHRSNVIQKAKFKKDVSSLDGTCFNDNALDES